MAFCSNCGTEYSDGDKFCKKCGADLSKANQAELVPEQNTEQKPTEQPAEPKKKSSIGKGCLIIILVFVLLGVGMSIISTIVGVTSNNDIPDTTQAKPVQQAKLDEDASKKLRKGFQESLQLLYDKQGHNINVELLGNNATILKLSNPLINDVWVESFKQETKNFDGMKEMGFEKILLENGKNFKRSFEL